MIINCPKKDSDVLILEELHKFLEELHKFKREGVRARKEMQFFDNVFKKYLKKLHKDWTKKYAKS